MTFRVTHTQMSCEHELMNKDSLAEQVKGENIRSMCLHIVVSLYFHSNFTHIQLVSLSLLTCELSEGIGDGDLDWKASWEMKPESWEETEERRAGVCWGSTEEEEEAR